MNPKLTVISLGLLTAACAPAQDMPWAKDFAAAQAAASKSGKLIMLDFFTEW